MPVSWYAAAERPFIGVGEAVVLNVWGKLQVAQDIWVCDKGTIKPWTKDIRAYKAKLAKTMKSQN